MEKILGKKYQLIGKVEGINRGNNFCNMTICLEDEQRVNLKIEDIDISKVHIGNIYLFDAKGVSKEDEVVLKLTGFKPIEEVLKTEELQDLMLKFYKYAPVSLHDMKLEIEKHIDSIENEVLRNITSYLYNERKNLFFTHPGGTKFHHAYVGGLAYHTSSMLKLADSFLNVYTYLNKDLLYSGVILHDIGKIEELTGVDGEYTTEGQLIGHLVMGAIDVEKAALSLGYEGREEVLLLKHMLISHHGQYNFGSPKKPMLAEALMLWHIDMIDSKFTVLGEELDHTKPGDWTTIIAVLDKMKFYNPKF